MAFRLDDFVICGEIDNTSNNSVVGWLGLRDREQPLPLHLTGNCDPDLLGRHIRFQIRETQEATRSSEPLASLASQQIGPTGTMTAARQVRVFDSSVEEFYHHAKLDEPLPTVWKPCLYLEWFSQNGRVVIELVDPLIEFVEQEDDEADHDEPQAEAGSRPGDESQHEEQCEASGEHFEDDAFDPFADDEPDESDDPYGLFPSDLQAHLDAEGAELDTGMGGEGASESLREMELMDSLIESGEDVPVGSIFEPPIKLPPADQLDDAEVEGALKALLARMAQYGIALDMCEHFTPRDAYVLLLEHICKEEGAFPELRDTQWVQHFMTHDFCPTCDAELEEELNEQDGTDIEDDEE